MRAQTSDSYIKACMKTWMYCEACAFSEKDNDEPRKLLIEKCSACSHSCFSVVCGIMNHSALLQDAALTCLLNCRECFEECDKYDSDEDVQYCGEVCRFCADMLKDLIGKINLN